MEWPGNDLGGGRGNLFDERLGKSMRWWATETADGRLILRRSAAIRCCALAAPLGVGGAEVHAVDARSDGGLVLQRIH